MELFHVLNRGVEKKNIFLDTQDYARFVHNLYEFNDTKPAQNSGRLSMAPSPMSDIGSHSLRNRLVDVHGWCLMKNHYHLLLSPRKEAGIQGFMRKINIGYAKYFNEKYARSGYVFQEKTKKVLIEKDAQFNYILHYIHLNPLDYLPGASEWRLRSKEHGIKNVGDALSYLDTYRWSSYLDYGGARNFPSLLTTGLFSRAFGSYKNALREYMVDTKGTVRNETLEFLPLVLE